jgi:hypothetical protein
MYVIQLFLVLLLLMIDKAVQTNFKGLHLHGGTSPPTHGESNKNGEAGPNEYRAIKLSFSKFSYFIYFIILFILYSFFIEIDSSADVGPFQGILLLLCNYYTYTNNTNRRLSTPID